MESLIEKTRPVCGQLELNNNLRHHVMKVVIHQHRNLQMGNLHKSMTMKYPNKDALTR